MLGYNVLKEFINKNVEVLINTKTYYGILQVSSDQRAITLSPVFGSYAQETYGPITLDANHVIAIRLIKPRSCVAGSDYDNEAADTTSDLA